jgi:hypothetical protein
MPCRERAFENSSKSSFLCSILPSALPSFSSSFLFSGVTITESDIKLFVFSVHFVVHTLSPYLKDKLYRTTALRALRCQMAWLSSFCAVPTESFLPAHRKHHAGKEGSKTLSDLLFSVRFFLLLSLLLFPSFLWRHHNRG